MFYLVVWVWSVSKIITSILNKSTIHGICINANLDTVLVMTVSTSRNHYNQWEPQDILHTYTNQTGEHRTILSDFLSCFLGSCWYVLCAVSSVRPGYALSVYQFDLLFHPWLLSCERQSDRAECHHQHRCYLGSFDVEQL